jgi:uncharacterized protein
MPRNKNKKRAKKTSLQPSTLLTAPLPPTSVAIEQEETNTSEGNPLLAAINGGQTKVALELLEAPVALELEQVGTTVLGLACQRGLDKVVHRLLALSVPIQACNSEGETPLYLAVAWKHEDIAKKLLQTGADPNICKKDGVSPLFMAAQHGSVPLIRELVSHGANLELCRHSDKLTPLLVGAYQGHHAAVIALLARGADASSLIHADINQPTVLVQYLKTYQEERAKAITLNKKGIKKLQAQRPKQALALFAASVEVYKTLYGQQLSLDLAVCYNNIGASYRNQGEHQKAVNYFCQSFEIYLNLLGGNHPLTCKAQNKYDTFVKDNAINADKDALIWSWDPFIRNSNVEAREMIDLHGCSVNEAKALLQKAFKKLAEKNLVELYIITGWGKHPSLTGGHGILKHALPKLLKPYAEAIEKIQEETGAYRIVLKKDLSLRKKMIDNLHLSEDVERIHILDCEHKAFAGNSEAMLSLAYYHLFNTIAGYSDEQKGIDWLERAHKSGSLNASALLGDFYREGLIVERDDRKALALIKVAAEGNLPYGQHLLAGCYLVGQCTKRDDEKGLYWLKKAADAGVVAAQHTLALSYFEGDFTPRNDELAVKYFTLAANQGYPAAQTQLARCYAGGYGLAQDYHKAFSYYLQAAQTDDLFAIYHVAKYLCSDRIGKPNFAAGFQWFLRGAELGDIDAQCEIAVSYYFGRWVTKDIEKAKIWLEKTLKANAPAAYWLKSRMYFTGEGEKQDPQEGLANLIKAAQQNFHAAIQELAVRYIEGLGVVQDAKQGLYWLAKWKDLAKNLDSPPATLAFSQQSPSAALSVAPFASFFKVPQAASDASIHSQSCRITES